MKGVVLCRCGRLMDDWIDVGALARRAGPDPRAAFVREEKFACFGEGLAAIVEAAKSGPVLVAACSPEQHGATLARALAAAGLPEDRAQLVDVRGAGWAARAKGRGASAAEALLADALDEVEAPAEVVAPAARAVLVGGSVAGDEAATLLEAAGVAVEWVDEPAESGGPERVERIAGGWRVERAGADAVEASAIVLAFAPLDAPAAAMAPGFEPGAQVLALADAEAALERLAEAAGADTAPVADGAEPAAEVAPGLPAEAPSVVCLVTGCLAGAGRVQNAGVQLARTVQLALALRARWSRAKLVLFHGDNAGAPPALEEMLRSFRRDAHGTTVKGAVHRGVYTEGSIMVHATDAALGKRLMVAADLVVVDAGLVADPRAAAWCARLGIPPAELAAGGVHTRLPGVLIASGPDALSDEDAAIRGAACAAHVMARVRG